MRIWLSFAALCWLAPVAQAADELAPATAGRFTMTPAPGGFLRLDTRTGAVSLCAVAGESVACRAAADDREALSQEIDRLSNENAALKARADAGSAGAAPLDPQTDRSLAVAETFLRRMMRVMRDETRAPN